MRCSPRTPSNSAFSFSGLMRGANILPWDMPAERALLSPLFLQACLGQIQPFRCFSCNLGCWGLFSFPLNAIFVGNAGDGKDAPWELMGDDRGETLAEKVSYPSSDHIRL